MQTDCLIVGAGVIGLSLAYELVCRGERVRVIDSGPIGRAASWAGAGILPAAATRGTEDPLEKLRSLSHRLHSEWAGRLKYETGIDTGYRRCGGIYLARSAAEAATLSANKVWWDDHGIEASRLMPSELAELEPVLSSLVKSGKLRDAWLLPDECQVRNPRFLSALSSACLQRGVELTPHCAATRIAVRPNGQAAVETADGELEAGKVCICSGAWARLHLAQLNLSSGIMPVRGQMVLYRTERPLLSRVINDGHRYLVPRDDGRLLAGSSEEEVGYKTETTTEIIGQLQDWATEIVPTLLTAEVERTWAGLRPGSFDGLPYLGKIHGLENAYVAAGHFRNGLHLSCGTAVVMADVILGQECGIDLNLFRVGRG